MKPELRSHRILAAIRATAKLHHHLEITDKRMRGAETKELGDATKAYREIVRDADERRPSLTPEESHSILPLICDGLATRDALQAAITLERKNRASERKRVDAALHELCMNNAFDGAQVELPLEGGQMAADQTGLGSFTAEVRAVVYTALLAGDERHELDTPQVELLADLASLEIDQIDFVLDAADAVEETDEGLDAGEIAELDHETADDLPI